MEASNRNVRVVKPSGTWLPPGPFDSFVADRDSRAIFQKIWVRSLVKSLNLLNLFCSVLNVFKN